MKQVIQSVKSGKLSVVEAPAPRVGRGEVLVATRASLISAGTERMLIEFAGKSLLGKAQERPDLLKKVIDKVKRDGLFSTAKSVFAQLEEPLPLGYSAAGEVIAVGAGMEHLYTVGDRVAVAGAGLANHAEVNAVPKNLTAKIPADVPFEQACYATLTAIAMQGFRNSKAVLGDKVLVMGLGLVGQLTVQLAKAAGCYVFATDFDASRVALAEEFGAKAHLMSAGNADGLVAEFTGGNGFDAVIICAATESDGPIEQAAQWARDKARIVMTGKTGTTLPYSDYMKKELEFVISRSYGPGRYDPNYEQKGQEYPIGFVRWTERENLQEALNLMASGKLDVAKLTTHSFPIEEGESAYELVMGKDTPFMGVVLTYAAPVEERLAPRLMLKETKHESGDVGVGLLGAGSFARAVLLPALKDVKGAYLTGILTRSGVTASTTGERFGFSYAARDEQELWGDDHTKAVVVATRHDTHARLVCEALKAGKHVFVEKPLAMNGDELEAVRKAHAASGRVLMVGFNRRFAPYTAALKDRFSKIPSARQVLIRVNAGQLPADNWQNDAAVGGGRLLGEACHFIDLALDLMNDTPKTVYAVRGEGQDVFTIVMHGEKGAMATVVYTSEGDSAFSKERVEVYAGGAVGVIDNFRDAWMVQNGKTDYFTLSKGFMGIGSMLGGSQDKGHGNEVLRFLSAVRGEAVGAGMEVESFFRSTYITLLAAQSMQEERPMECDSEMRMEV